MPNITTLLPSRAHSSGGGKMRKQIAACVCSVALGLMALSTLAIAQQKTAKACLDEWRANKGTNQADKVTERAYIARCRAGGSPAQSAAGSKTPAPLVTGSGNPDRQVRTTVRDIMESIIDPSADGIWGAVGTVVDGEGTHELLPKTPEDWTELRHAAVRIIEGSNLLMMPDRQAAPAGSKSEAAGVELEPPQITALIKRNRKAFDSFAEALRALGLDALHATDSKDAVSLMNVGARMENVCEGCHQTFWYPQVQNAPAAKLKR
jgi:hypothetical protein